MRDFSVARVRHRLLPLAAIGAMRLAMPHGQIVGAHMPVWWVGLVGIVALVTGFISNIDGLKVAGVLVLVSAALGVVVGLLRGR